MRSYLVSRLHSLRRAFLLPTTVAALGVVTVSSSASPLLDRPNPNREVLASRYTSISLDPADEDYNPIAVAAKITFPRAKVSTVGDAVRYLLIRTGYDLVPSSKLDPQVVNVLSKRLPDSQRELGIYSVETMLGVLLGDPFSLRVDHIARQISYVPRVDLSPKVAATPGDEAGSGPAQPTAAVTN